MVYGQQSTAYKQTSRLLMASSTQFMASSSWPAVYDQLRVINFRMLNTSARLTRVKRVDLRIHLSFPESNQVGGVVPCKHIQEFTDIFPRFSRVFQDLV